LAISDIDLQLLVRRADAVRTSTNFYQHKFYVCYVTKTIENLDFAVSYSLMHWKNNNF